MSATCCDATVALVASLAVASACPVCGERYLPDDATRVALVPAAPSAPDVLALAAYAPQETQQRPSLAPDARVSVSHDPRPSSAPPVARLTHVEDVEVVEVRAVLCELRPDKGGPLGWAPDGEAPVGAKSIWTPALRGGSSEVPAILPGAFAPTVAASRAPDLDHGYPGLTDEARATLRWMQRSGTLKQGLRALYQACALASTVSTQEQRDAWAAMAEGVRVAARVVFGRKRVRAAIGAWRCPAGVAAAENPPSTPTDRAEWAARDTATEVAQVVARVRARVGMDVGGEGAGG